ncbi:MAG: protein translocase subunit SecF [Pseudanabaenaceae cyanobacterium]
MKLDVIKYRYLYLGLSALVIALGLVGMFLCGQRFGFPLRPSVDFTGGTRLSLSLVCANPPKDCGQPIDLEKLRAQLASQNYEKLTVQAAEEGRGVVVQTGDLAPPDRQKLEQFLGEALKPYGTIDPNKTQIDRVGPLISQELLRGGSLALAVALLGIVAYLSVRFQPDYAVFATLALVHDVLVVSGVFAWLGLLGGVEVDSLFIVALLTIAGYSVNDTVIIYDRIRENLKQPSLGATPSGEPVEPTFNQVVNFSVNQTLTRSINTTLTTILPLLAVLLFGGATLKFFALALLVGFIAGTYSSIFNATILLAWWRGRQAVA